MDDLEITKLCAEALGLEVRERKGKTRVYDPKYGTVVYGIGDNWICSVWNPLHYDAQAMALVKKMRLQIKPWMDGKWFVYGFEEEHQALGLDLNRAICECVAQMQAAKNETDKRFGQPHYGH